MAVAALALYVVFIAAGFGWKSYRQWRTTGSTGFEDSTVALAHASGWQGWDSARQ